MKERFVVLVRDHMHERVFGVYRSFKKASGDAKAWNGTVTPLESQDDAYNPWDARGKPTEPRPLVDQWWK
jgi:hypothetical protein